MSRDYSYINRLKKEHARISGISEKSLDKEDIKNFIKDLEKLKERYSNKIIIEEIDKLIGQMESKIDR